jgi:hypothetical protein
MSRTKEWMESQIERQREIDSLDDPDMLESDAGEIPDETNLPTSKKPSGSPADKGQTKPE